MFSLAEMIFLSVTCPDHFSHFWLSPSVTTKLIFVEKRAAFPGKHFLVTSLYWAEIKFTFTGTILCASLITQLCRNVFYEVYRDAFILLWYFLLNWQCCSSAGLYKWSYCGQFSSYRLRCWCYPQTQISSSWFALLFIEVLSLDLPKPQLGSP